MPMNSVTTGHFVRGVTTGKQVFLTHGAIGVILARLAIVVVKQLDVNAHAAIVTVTKVFTSSNTAEAAVCAMVGRFFCTHPQVANVAMVFSKRDTALFTLIAVTKEERFGQKK